MSANELPVFITNSTMEKVKLGGNWYSQTVEAEEESKAKCKYSDKSKERKGFIQKKV
jgi:hypothetical protein